MVTHRFPYAVITSLLLTSSAVGCKREATTEAGTEVEPSAHGDGDVDFPSYPSGSDGGMLWLESKGGPLGDKVYQAKPSQVGFTDYFYSQSDSEGRKGEPVVYTIDLGDIEPGTHDLGEGQLKFYVGDGTNTHDRYYEVTGKVRVDANDRSGKHMRILVSGTATEEGSKKTSPVALAIVLKG